MSNPTLFDPDHCLENAARYEARAFATHSDNERTALEEMARRWFSQALLADSVAKHDKGD